jgi:hypothetical protein
MGYVDLRPHKSFAPRRASHPAARHALDAVVVVVVRQPALQIACILQ